MCLDNLQNDFFVDSSGIVQHYSEVVQWAYSKRSHYTDNALNEFLDAIEADAFLVAYALADKSDRIIGIQEKSQPEIKRKMIE